MNQSAAENKIFSGRASRYIKNRWIAEEAITTEAFDLRDGDPPETYVSHFITIGTSTEEQFRCALNIISSRIRDCQKQKGGIAILCIEEALEEVNDSAEPFIEFVKQGLPHCGLIYVTADEQDIKEAKTTLCFLAQRNFQTIKKLNGNPGLPPRRAIAATST